VPHHGLDLVDPDEPFTAADYRQAALEALAGIETRGRVALLVGGTGLYLRAVARGLPLDATGADAALRAELEERHARHGLDALVRELLERDAAVAAATDLRNPRRVIRALERAATTGSARPPPPPGYRAPVLWLGLAAAATTHRATIEARAREQFERGLLDEATRLRETYPQDLPAFSAMGYREAFDVLAGRADLASAIATDTARTWRYARRQATWFRSESDITWLATGDGLLERAWRVVRHVMDG
jgi:tRNA dimethylallyltransferase